VSGTLNAAGAFQVGGVPIIATAAEINYLDGVTSNIQTQLNGKQPTIGTSITIGTWTITDSAGTLRFSNGSNRFSIDPSGNIVADNNVTAYGSP